ncbi:hypothetical protein L1787_05625 [Acuticoccus sp. M5D2P5]|uniref:hypothetical protein n=1 Tax=Acuticoccus kalidii TaxID=2910977 RepID=UPI001F2FFC89|nr:hypothetical protein [Acuticoccus kalidii]MCF3932893.1 hypothetical protein [Acuticoccus kalidii]
MDRAAGAVVLMPFPSRPEIAHWLHVATRFSPLDRAFWVGLLHDSVEDGYLPAGVARWWPALDAITRRPGEPYRDGYLPRLALNTTARRVKIEDIRHNLMRNGGPPGDLKRRYLDALEMLEWEGWR